MWEQKSFLMSPSMGIVCIFRRLRCNDASIYSEKESDTKKNHTLYFKNLLKEVFPAGALMEHFLKGSALLRLKREDLFFNSSQFELM